MVNACWWYYFSKFTEFFDTVSIHHFVKNRSIDYYIFFKFFFVFRKKTSQVSWLHIIHHGVMPISGKLIK